MSTVDHAMKKARPDGWWYPWIFVAAMGFVFVINGIMVTIALSTWTGLETEGHYQKGLAYNQNLNAAKAQQALGWQLKIDALPIVSSGSTREVDMVARFTGPDGTPLNGLDVTVFFLRPTHEGFDREAVLTENEPGQYSARLSLPLAGQWNARIHAFRGEDVFQEERRLRIR
jgi:nitrogen fixation protein FixH